MFITTMFSFFSIGCSEYTNTSKNYDETQTNLTIFIGKGPSGNTEKLANMTTFLWDNVYYFIEGTSKIQIERIIDVQLELDESAKNAMYSARSYLIFVKDNKIVNVITNTPELFITGEMGKAYTYQNALVVVHTKDPGPYTVLRVS